MSPPTAAPLRALAARLVVLAVAGTAMICALTVRQDAPELRVSVLGARLLDDSSGEKPWRVLRVRTEGGDWRRTFRGKMYCEVNTERGWRRVLGRCGVRPPTLVFGEGTRSFFVPRTDVPVRVVVEIDHSGWLGLWHDVERSESVPFVPTDLIASLP